jgi:hypothetical protein
MGNLKNAALFWCKIKGYLMLALAAFFAFFLVKNLLTMSSAKNPEDRDIAKSGAISASVFVGMFLLFYFLLKTYLGCGISIASNVYQIAR